MDATNMWGVGWNDPFMGATGFGTQLANYQQTLQGAGVGGTPETTGSSPAVPASVGLGAASAPATPPSPPQNSANVFQSGGNYNTGIVPAAQGGSPVPAPSSPGAPIAQQRQPWQTPQFWNDFSSQMQNMNWSDPSSWNNFGTIMHSFFDQFGRPSTQGGVPTNQLPQSYTNYQNGYLPQNTSQGAPQGGLTQASGYVGP